MNKGTHANITLQKCLILYKAIEEYRAKNFDSPSRIDIAKMKRSDGLPLISTSTSVVNRYLEIMTELKMVHCTPKRSRSIHLLPPEGWAMSVRRVNRAIDLENET